MSKSSSSISKVAGGGVELEVGTVLGKYVIESLLGVGGFGITYLARCLETDTQVVIKENMPGALARRAPESQWVTPQGNSTKAGFDWALDRFVKEARLLAGLNHRNIVRVTEAFEALGTAYYVMPWVGGKELGKAAPAPGEITEQWLSPMLATLLRTFSYLHRQNLLHRDVKPNNILVQDGDTPVLIDFGAAKAIVAECDDTVGAERSSVMMVAHGYTPIEQLQTGGKLGPWTDLYALGATCYKVITGTVPPDSISRAARVDPYQPLTQFPELKGRFSRAFLRTIDKALAPDSVNRWQRAEDWLRALPAPPSASGKKRAVLPWMLCGLLAAGYAAAVPYHMYLLSGAGSFLSSNSEQEISRLQHELTQVSRERDAALHLKNAAQAELEDVVQRNNAVQEELREANRRISSAQAELQTAKREKSEAESEAESLRERVKTAEFGQLSANNNLSAYVQSVEKGMISREQAQVALTKRGIPHSGSALYDAACKGEADKLRLLIAAGVDVNSTGGNGRWPALTMAAYGGHTECVRLLLQASGISVNKKEQSKSEGTALYWAVCGRKYECISLLLAHRGIDVNMADSNASTPLHAAVANGDYLSVAMLLNHSGIDKNRKDKNGATPLQNAKTKKHEKCERLLRS